MRKTINDMGKYQTIKYACNWNSGREEKVKGQNKIF